MICVEFERWNYYNYYSIFLNHKLSIYLMQIDNEVLNKLRVKLV